MLSHLLFPQRTLGVLSRTFPLALHCLATDSHCIKANKLRGHIQLGGLRKVTFRYLDRLLY